MPTKPYHLYLRWSLSDRVTVEAEDEEDAAAQFLTQLPHQFDATLPADSVELVAVEAA